MSAKDRIRWNKKYKTMTNSKAPTALVTRFFDLARPGPALDLGAGQGRNALFLAQNGFAVDAVDISDVAMDDLAGRHPAVRAICRDLESYEIPTGQYTLIVNTRFLMRRLFPFIIEGLAPGGILIFETFIEAPPGEGPSCRDYLLRENELLHAFLSLKIRYYEEKHREAEGRKKGLVAALVAQKR